MRLPELGPLTETEQLVCRDRKTKHSKHISSVEIIDTKVKTDSIGEVLPTTFDMNKSYGTIFSQQN